MNILEKIREKLAGARAKFEDFLDDHKEEANAVILGVQTTYSAMHGHEKMEMAIALFLEAIKIPAVFSVMASQKIVDAIEKFLQKQYDELKSEGKL